MVSAATITSKVLSAVKKVGTVATFTESTVDVTTYDPDTGEAEEIDPVTVTVHSSPLIDHNQYYPNSQSTELAQRSILFIPHQDFVPEVNMSVVIGSFQGKVVEVRPTWFKDTTVLYEVHLVSR